MFWTANIADIHYMGPDTVVKTFVPLLKPLALNKHATLITLYINAVKVAEQRLMGPEYIETKRNACLKKYDRSGYREAFVPISLTDPRAPRRMDECDLLADHVKPWERFIKRYDFANLAKENKARIKDKHTIVDAWPLAPKKKLGTGRSQGRISAVGYW